MATTITNATMTVTISENVKLNGVQQGGTNTLTISPINECAKRIVSIPTAETGLLGFAAAIETDLAKSYVAGQFDEDAVVYIRITNKDDTNHCSLTFRNEDSDEFGLKLDKGQSFIYNGDLAAGVVDTMEADGAAITPGTFADLVDITALADGDVVDLEVFVASL